MTYADGTDIEPGDRIRIDRTHRGRVVASMDTGKDAPGQETWADLESGIMVDTGFAGLVHHTAETAGDFTLIARDPAR